MTTKKTWPFFSANNGSSTENPAASDSPVNQPAVVGEKITFTWNPMNQLVWTQNKQMLQCVDESERLERKLDDISHKMRIRALKDYGYDNGSGVEYMPEEKGLQHLWRYIRKTRKLERQLNIKPEQRIFGISQVFRFAKMNSNQYVKAILSQTISKSDVHYLEWCGLDQNHSVRMPVYRSDERERALMLCEWGGGVNRNAGDNQTSNNDCLALDSVDSTSDAPVETMPIECNVNRLIDELEKSHEYTRAAAISIFNLNMKRAIDILSKAGSSKNSPYYSHQQVANINNNTTAGSSSNSISNRTVFTNNVQLYAVAMALSGYTGPLNNSLWQEKCSSLRSAYKDPYLKSIFYFLTCVDKDNSYDEILYEKSLKLSDRVAFALLYLSDEQLEKYLLRITQNSIDAGDIEALSVIGLSDEGLQLLQEYVNRTSDIQTVSLIILNALPNLSCDLEQARIWVNNYKDFLDRQRLWQLTARFNIRWHRIAASGSSIIGDNNSSPSAQLLPAEQVPPQIYVNCNFCGNNIASSLQLMMIGSNMTGGRSGGESTQRKQVAASSGSTNGGRSGSLDQQLTNTARRPELAAVAAAAAAGQQCGRVSVSAACQKTRVQACPNCRKPLPRCALCCTHLGTAASAVYFRPTDQQQEDKLNNRILGDTGNRKMTPFSSWFSWCQSCRHGGHAQHMLEWFSRNVECPVSGCTCKCMSIDGQSAKLKIEM